MNFSVLRQLRAGHEKRPEGFPQSGVLCGVRDIRDYRCVSCAERIPMSRAARLSIYPAALVAGIVFFFLLHHAGNQLPYDLAKQRFQAEFDATQRDAGHARGFKIAYEYCELSSAVMAGARGGGSPLRDALLVPVLRKDSDGSYCGALREAAGGGEPEPDSGPLITRYWWGSKALYAIALRALSVYELRELTKTATRLAYALLAVAVLLLSPKALAVISPLILLGAFHSGVDYFGDVANGMPYAWAVLSAAVLAFLMRFRAPGAAPWGRARFFSFVAGMVSSYLWLGDGHTFLAVTLIGLIAYFGHERAGVRERVEQAVRCIGLYLAGFLICYGLGLLVKTAAWGGIDPLADFLDQVIHTFEKTDGDLASGATDFSRYLDLFHELGWGLSTVRSGGVLTALAGGVLTPLALCALVAALLVSAWEAYRARPHLLPGILWIVALMLVNVPNLIVSEDMPYRTARFLFVMHGLCFSCLILAVLKMRGMIRASLLAAGVAGVAGVYLSSRIWVEYADPRVLELIEDTQPVIRSRFDVYYADNQLIYTKEQCTEEDVTPRFFLHVIPADPADLEHPSFSFNNLDFNFIPGVFRSGLDDGRCISIRPLPGYAIERIGTGQFFFGEEPLWKGEASLVDRSGQASSYADPRVLDLIEDTEPVIRSRFDVYYADNQLIYTKEQCTEEDVTPRFFLHVIPADPADLETPYFNNLDFEFIPGVFRDGLDDGRCVSIRPLPDYAVERIRTGQFFFGEERLWKGEANLAGWRTSR